MKIEQSDFLIGNSSMEIMMKTITQVVSVFFVLVLSGCAATDLVPKSKQVNKAPKNDIVVTINGVDEELTLSKDEWSVEFVCKQSGGSNNGSLSFHILKNTTEPNDDLNALLVFSDHSANIGKLFRDGLDWRFDWVSVDTEKQFSVVIKQNSDAYYYEWSLADDKGRMSVNQTLSCR